MRSTIRIEKGRVISIGIVSGRLRQVRIPRAAVTAFQSRPSYESAIFLPGHSVHTAQKPCTVPPPLPLSSSSFLPLSGTFIAFFSCSSYLFSVFHILPILKSSIVLLSRSEMPANHFAILISVLHNRGVTLEMLSWFLTLPCFCFLYSYYCLHSGRAQ